MNSPAFFPALDRAKSPLSRLPDGPALGTIVTEFDSE